MRSPILECACAAKTPPELWSSTPLACPSLSRTPREPPARSARSARIGRGSYGQAPCPRLRLCRRTTSSRLARSSTPALSRNRRRLCPRPRFCQYQRQRLEWHSLRDVGNHASHRRAMQTTATMRVGGMDGRDSNLNAALNFAPILIRIRERSSACEAPNQVLPPLPRIRVPPSSLSPSFCVLKKYGALTLSEQHVIT